MSKRIIELIILLMVVVAPAGVFAAKKITWMPKSIKDDISIGIGKEKSYTVVIKSAKDVGNLEIKADPKIEPFLSFSTKNIEYLPKHAEWPVIITLRPPADAKPGVYRGGVYLVSNNKKVSKKLKVKLYVYLNSAAFDPVVTLPAGSQYSPGSLNIEQSSVKVPIHINGTQIPIGTVYDITIDNVSNPEFGSEYATLEYTYDPSVLAEAGLLEEFNVHYFDDLDATWKPVDKVVTDYENNRVIAYVSHFTPFVLTAVPEGGSGVPAPPASIYDDFPDGIGGSGNADFMIVDDNFRYYQDRNYYIQPLAVSVENQTTFAALGFEQAMGISTNNGDGTNGGSPAHKHFAGDDYINFTAHMDLDVYVLYDSRGGIDRDDISEDAPWLSAEGFSADIATDVNPIPTRYFLETTDAVQFYTVYRKSYLQGEEVRLHGNRQGVVDTAINTNYWVILKRKDVFVSEPASALLVSNPDTTPPLQISNLTAIPGAGLVNLNWQNPDDLDFAGVVIRKGLSVAPADISDGIEPVGTVLSPQSYRDTDILPGNTYYYTVFSVDENYNHQAGVSVSTTTSIDFDGDGLADSYENDPLNTYPFTGGGTDATNADTDGDGINDGDEVAADTDPTNPDNLAPVITQFSLLGNAAVSDPLISFDLAANDETGISGWMITLSDAQPLNSHSQWQVTQPTSYMLPSISGSYSIFVWAKDAAGNVSVSYTSIDIDLDVNKPVLTEFTLSSLTPTANNLVTFVLNGSDDIAVTDWIITESSTPPVSSDPAWQTSLPNFYMLPNVSGSYSLYAWARDAVGNVNDAYAAITIDLDVDQPFVSDFSLVSLSPTVDPIVSFTLNASDNIAVTGWMITTSATQPLASDPAWLAASPGSYTLPATSNSYSLYVWVRDAVGNVSNLYAPINVELDIDAPLLTDFSLSGGSPTTDITINFNLSGTDNSSISAWFVSLSATTPLLSDPAWQTIKPSSFVLPMQNNTVFTLYAWARDAAGNISASLDFDVELRLIINDCALLVPIAGTVDEATSLQVNSSVQIDGLTNLSNGVDTAAFLVAQWGIGADGTDPASDGSWSWQNAIANASASDPIVDQYYANIAVATPGSYDYAARFSVDSSTTWVYCDSNGSVDGYQITNSGDLNVLDTTSPIITDFSLLTGANTLNPNVSFSLVGSDLVGISEWLITTTGTTPSPVDSGWTATKPTGYTLPSQGSYTLYAWAKDAADNISAPYAPITVLLDTEAPVVTNFSLIGADTTNNAVVAFDLSASDNNSITGWMISEGGTLPLVSDPAWSAIQPSTYTLSADGSYNLYIWAIDVADNISAIYTPISITLDTQGPQVTDFSLLTPSATTDPLVRFNLEATDTTSISAWLVTDSGVLPSISDPRWQATAPSEYALPLAAGNYTLYAWAIDIVDNINSPVSVSIDLSEQNISIVKKIVNDGFSDFNIYDAYPGIVLNSVDVMLVAGGGGGGGGGGARFTPATGVTPGDGGGGGGAGQRLTYNIANLSDYDFAMPIRHKVGGFGEGGYGGQVAQSAPNNYGAGTGGSSYIELFNTISSSYERSTEAKGGTPGSGGASNANCSYCGRGGFGYPYGQYNQGANGGNGGNNGFGNGVGGVVKQSGQRAPYYSGGGGGGGGGGAANSVVGGYGGRGGYGFIEITIDGNVVLQDNRHLKFAWLENDGNDTEVYYWNGSETVQITSDAINTNFLRLSGDNVVWSDGRDILLWDGSQTYNITEDPIYPANFHEPKSSGRHIVFQEYISGNDLYLWDGQAISQITNNGNYKIHTHIADDRVIWIERTVSGPEYNIMLYDGAQTLQLTDNPFAERAPQVSGGNAVWFRVNGVQDLELVVYDELATPPLRVVDTGHIEYVYNDDHPIISGNNIVWTKYDGSAYDVFLWDGVNSSEISSDIQLAAAGSIYVGGPDRSGLPQIYGNNVVWMAYDTNNFPQIFYFDGNTVQQLTSNTRDIRITGITITDGFVSWVEAGLDIRYWDGSSVKSLAVEFQAPSKSLVRVSVDNSPEVASFALTSPAVTNDTTISVDLTAVDPLLASAWTITFDDLPPSPTDPSWQSTNITTFSLPAESGEYQLYVWLMNDSGDVSHVQVPITVTLDLDNPNVDSFTLLSASPTNNAVVEFNVEVSDNHSIAEHVYTLSPVQPLASDPAWVDGEPVSSQILTSASGTYDFYLWIKDEAGNISPVATPVTVVLDVDEPVITDFTRTSGSPTSNRNITFDLSGSDNFSVAEWLVTDSASQPAATDLGWQSTVPTSYLLTSTVSGVHDLYAWAKDAAGNISSASISINVDFTVPPLVWDAGVWADNWQ